jgi:hypothetical protein
LTIAFRRHITLWNGEGHQVEFTSRGSDSTGNVLIPSSVGEFLFLAVHTNAGIVVATVHEVCLSVCLSVRILCLENY